MDDLARTVGDLHGEAGVDWLGRLPRLLADCVARWGLTPEPPFAGLSYHYVAPATCADGTRVVLKAGVPGPSLCAEAAALRHYGGRGAVRLLDAEEDQGVLLLERLEPGATLVTMAEDAATRIAADVMRGLWAAPPSVHAFPTLDDLGRDFPRLRAQFGGPGPLPPALVGRAEAALAELLVTQAAPVLLHGDLHHGNILSARRAMWLAIDPKGIVGEPAFEAAQFLLNPSPPPKHVLARRLDIFSEALGLDRARLRGWGLIKAMLSAWWSVEDHGRGWEGAVTVAASLAALPDS